jgi:hypothetical protein
MKILYFDNLNYCDYADLVTCYHCDNYALADAMLVPTGTEFCPVCGDCTSWTDDNVDNREVNIEEIFKTNEIIHITANYAEEYDDMNEEPVLIPLSKD